MGLVFIVIGLILAVNALGIAHINIFFDGWWTIGLLIGIALLLCCQDVLDFDMVWKLIFPAILIALGISFIFKDTINSKVNKEIKK